MPKISLDQIDEYFQLCKKQAGRLDSLSDLLKKSDPQAADEAYVESVQFEALASMLQELKSNFTVGKARVRKGPDNEGTCG